MQTINWNVDPVLVPAVLIKPIPCILNPCLETAVLTPTWSDKCTDEF